METLLHGPGHAQRVERLLRAHPPTVCALLDRIDEGVELALQRLCMSHHDSLDRLVEKVGPVLTRFKGARVG